MGKGGGDTTTVQKADPHIGIQPYLYGGTYSGDNFTPSEGISGIYPEAQKLYGLGPISPYEGERVATMPTWLTDAATGGIQSSINLAPEFQNLMMGGLNALLGDLDGGGGGIYSGIGGGGGVSINVPAIEDMEAANVTWAQLQDPNYDPTLSAAIEAILKGGLDNPYIDQMTTGITSQTEQAWRDMSTAINKELLESVLPGIEQQFNLAGGPLGSSRQALLSGNAIGQVGDALARESEDMSQNLAAVLSQLYGNLYESATGRQATLAQYLAGLEQADRFTRAQLEQQGLLQQSQFEQEANRINYEGDLQQKMAAMQAAASAAAASKSAALQAAALQQQGILSALGLLPQLSQLPTNMVNAQISSYAPLLGEQQSLINADMAKYYEGQMAPWENLQRYASIIQPGAGVGMSGMTTGSGPEATLGDYAMGGMGGYMLGSQLAGTSAMAAYPAMAEAAPWLGAAAGVGL